MCARRGLEQRLVEIRVKYICAPHCCEATFCKARVLFNVLESFLIKVWPTTSSLSLNISPERPSLPDQPSEIKTPLLYIMSVLCFLHKWTNIFKHSFNFNFSFHFLSAHYSVIFLRSGTKSVLLTTVTPAFSALPQSRFVLSSARVLTKF